MLEQNKVHIQNILTVPFKKSKMVSFASSIIKGIVAPSSRSKFSIKLTYCIAFGSASIACCLLKLSLLLSSVY